MEWTTAKRRILLETISSIIFGMSDDGLNKILSVLTDELDRLIEESESK